MIDELVKAANAIEKVGIKTQDWHPKLKVLPKIKKKAPCIRIWLTADGHIHDIEPLAEERVAQLRKYEPHNGRSLPGFNVRPIFRLVKPQDEIQQAGRGAAGETLKMEWTKAFFNCEPAEQANNDFWEKTREGLNQSFGKVREDLENLCNESLEENETLNKFIKIVAQIDLIQFQNEYFEKLLPKITDGTLPVTMMCYFVDKAKKNKEDSDSRVAVPKFSVFLDVLDYTDYPVAHEKTISRLNDILCGSDREEGNTLNQNTAQDAYGLDANDLNKKFPEVSLPFLGGIKLRSQVKAVPAQSRYNLCEGQTFHVGTESRKRTKRALEWLSKQEHNGSTYGIAGDNELLFAYPSTLPKEKIPLAKMFGAQNDNAYQREDKFEQLSQSVVKQLQGLGQTALDSQLELFSLRKMDKARTKVAYYRNVTLESLEDASTAWHEGCQNIPTLNVWDWSEVKNKKTGKSYPIAVKGLTVFPIKLHRYLNSIWKKDGTRADSNKSKTKIFEPTDGLRLLLERQNKGMIAHMFERFMQHAQGYFLTLCRSKGKNEIANLPDKRIYPGILGLLLKKSGKNKEVFMNESAFLLGRCLRITDEIHRLYCEVVRKNELPSELCGSSLLIGMMESPVSTLSQLAMRSAPYVKWACAYHDDKSVKKNFDGTEIKIIVLVKSWWNRWSEVADQLHSLEWPKRLTPEERAQVFLGYLASFPKNKPKKEDDHTDSKNMAKQGDKK